jgi:hypothetical protein
MKYHALAAIAAAGMTSEAVCGMFPAPRTKVDVRIAPPEITAAVIAAAEAKRKRKNAKRAALAKVSA